MEQPPNVSERLAAIRKTFPNARNLEVKSPRTREYNCIAYAMGEETRNWWPNGHGAGYWPPGTMAELNRTSFRWAFTSKGYKPCADGQLIPGVEKVCLYEKGGVPTHAARQLPNGRWTSKLGPDEDVEHDLSDLEGRRYGSPSAWFARPVRNSSALEVEGVVEPIESGPPIERP